VIGEKDVADTEKPDIGLDASFWCGVAEGNEKPGAAPGFSSTFCS
jgi:hypothetical protein